MTPKWHNLPVLSVACMELITQTVGFGTQVQPSPSVAIWVWCCIIIGYYWYYSSMYNIYWCLILLCDGQVVSDHKNLKSK